MRFRDLRKASGKKPHPLARFRFFHVNGKEELTELCPSRFDVCGRMEESAVFVTDREHIGTWAAWVRDGSSKVLFLYGVLVPENARVEEGRNGAEGGDFKVVTDKPVPCEFIRPI